MYSKIDVRIKLLHLVVSIILIFLTNNYGQVVSMFFIGIILLMINKISIKKLFRYVTYVLFISMFIFVFNYLILRDLDTALVKSSFIFIKYMALIIYSLNFKFTSTNKEVAYSVIYYLKPFKKVMNLNRLYTIILLVLNQIHNLAKEVKDMYRIRLLNGDYTSKISKFKLSTSLLAPLINKVLYQNEEVTISLVNKGYSEVQSNVNIYVINEAKFINYMFILFVTVVQIILLGVL